MPVYPCQDCLITSSSIHTFHSGPSIRIICCFHLRFRLACFSSSSVLLAFFPTLIASLVVICDYHAPLDILCLIPLSSLYARH